MSLQNGSCPNVTSASAEATRLLAVRSSIYAILARGFSNPDERVIEFFRHSSHAQIEPQGEISTCLAKVLEAGKSVAREELAIAYMRLFHPLNGPFPYQCEHAKAHEFSKSQTMADIMGFYLAFGVEPDNDRPDHIAAQLEFMHLLTLKEKHALDNGQLQKASLCQEASEKFLRQHLLTWTDPLVHAMRADKDNMAPFYFHLTALLKLFMEAEKRTLA